MENKRKSKTKSVLKTLVVAIFLAAAVWGYLNRQFIEDNVASFNFKPSQQIESLTNRLDLTATGRLVLFASLPEVKSRDDFQSNCVVREDDINILGCYSFGKIFVYDITDPELDGIKEVTLAHEMLHAVYERLSSQEKSRLAPYLEQVYNQIKDEDLESRMSYYERNEPDERYNELHSIIGTEVASSKVPAELEQHYGKYFANRSKVVELHDSYQGKFSELKQKADELKAKLEELADEINKQRVEYDENWANLSAEIAEFNRRAEAGYFVSQAAFDAERSLLVGKVATLDKLWGQINDQISNYNLIVEEYNEISLRAEKLNSSLDSAPVPAPAL
jgi:hypothetical protein